MRYIITEEQNNVLSVRRRISQDYDLIREIVAEGREMFICQFDTFKDFYEFLCQDSAMTYLLNYFDYQYQEGYLKMEEYIISFIKENFKEMIVTYWEENKEDC